MRRLTLLLLLLLAAGVMADPAYNGLCDHNDWVANLPKVINQIDSYSTEVVKLQDKVVQIAEGQGLPIPIPRIAKSGTELVLMPITEPVRLVREFTDGITNANMQVLKASADQVKWAVNQQVQLFRLANDSLVLANQYLIDVNEALMDAATEPLRQLQTQLTDSIDTLTDIINSTLPDTDSVTEAIEDLFDDVFGGGLW
jgi:hypothetical protein